MGTVPQYFYLSLFLFLPSPRIFCVAQPNSSNSGYRLGYFQRSSVGTYKPRAPPTSSPSALLYRCTYPLDIISRGKSCLTFCIPNFTMGTCKHWAGSFRVSFCLILMLRPPMNRLFTAPRAAEIESIGQEFSLRHIKCCPHFSLLCLHIRERIKSNKHSHRKELPNLSEDAPLFAGSCDIYLFDLRHRRL